MSILVTSALFIGAEIARKPVDEFASAIWSRFKLAFNRVFAGEPTAEQVTASNITKIMEAVPEIRRDLDAVYSSVSALRRAKLVRSVTEGATILWIDDRPQNNTWERSLMSALGISIVAVETTRSALDCLRHEDFDVVLSDIARGENQREGVNAISSLRAISADVPIVFYVANLGSGPPPTGSQVITNEPNELLHLVLDELERRRV